MRDAHLAQEQSRVRLQTILNGRNLGELICRRRAAGSCRRLGAAGLLAADMRQSRAADLLGGQPHGSMAARDQFTPLCIDQHHIPFALA